MGQIYVKGYRRGHSLVKSYTRRGIRIRTTRRRRGTLQLDVFKGKELVAYASTSKLKPGVRGTLNINQLKVMPSEQGQGLGKVLYKALLRKSTTRGGIRKSDVITHDAVHSIYRKIGVGNTIGRYRGRHRLKV